MCTVGQLVALPHVFFLRLGWTEKASFWVLSIITAEEKYVMVHDTYILTLESFQRLHLSLCIFHWPNEVIAIRDSEKWASTILMYVENWRHVDSPSFLSTNILLPTYSSSVALLNRDNHKIPSSHYVKFKVQDLWVMCSSGNLCQSGHTELSVCHSWLNP